MPDVALTLTNCRRCDVLLCTQPVRGAEDLAEICHNCLTPDEKLTLLSACGPEAISRALIRQMYNPPAS